MSKQIPEKPKAVSQIVRPLGKSLMMETIMLEAQKQGYKVIEVEGGRVIKWVKNENIHNIK